MPVEEFNLQTSKEQENSANKQKRSSDLLGEFASYTTLHGFHFVLDSFTTMRRLVWATLLLAGMALLFFQCYEGYKKLHNNDSVTAKELLREEQIVFPAVTICNQNMLRKSKILGTKVQTFLDDFESLFFTQNLSSSSNETFTLNLENAVKEAGHNLSDMLGLCIWGGKPCTPEDFYVHISFARGLCYTFNSGRPGYPLRHQKTGGRTQGLVVQLNAQPDQYYGPFNLFDGTGFRVLVHDQGDWPDMENYGIDVSTGFSTSIGIKRQKFLHLPPPFKSKCGERKLMSSQKYSQSVCELECMTRVIIGKCECKTLGMASSVSGNVSRFCSPMEIVKCSIPASETIRSSVNCDCSMPCEEIRYDVKASSASFPSRHLLPVLMRRMNVSNVSEANLTNIETEIRRYLVQLNIFYQGIVTEEIREKPAYDIHDFGSDVGGNMGLFLGCSLLTIFEFVDLFILLCCGNRASCQKVHTGT